MKKTILILSLFLLAACGGKTDNTAGEGIKSPPPPPGGYGATLPPIPFNGDACEYAKLVFIQAYQEYQKHLGDQVLYSRQQQARLAAQAMCNAEKEESKTWACAVGHSCRE